MSRLHRQKMRQRFAAEAGAGNRDRDRAVDDVQRFVARGQAAQAAVDSAIATATKPKAKRAKRKAASARRRR